MNTQYGNKWFDYRKRLIETWDSDRAQTCHETRKPYAAVLDVEDGRKCVVEFCANFVSVGFFDQQSRQYMDYVFDEVVPGRLFLQRAVYREFIGDTDKVAKGSTYMFSVDGHVRITRKDFIREVAENKEEIVDVSSNWDTYPVFGIYDSLIRKER